MRKQWILIGQCLLKTIGNVLSDLGEARDEKSRAVSGKKYVDFDHHTVLIKRRQNHKRSSQYTKKSILVSMHVSPVTKKSLFMIII